MIDIRKKADLIVDKYGLVIDDDGYFCEDKIDELLTEVKRLREDNKKLHDAINGCAYANMQGSALDLYCESIIERCPTCDENIESGLCNDECGCEEE